jgi:NAD(P) transhydrogenase subunit alpha
MEDDVIRGATVVKEGNITWPPPPPKVQAIAPAPPPAAPVEPVKPPQRAKGTGTLITMAVGAVVLAFIGAYAPPAFMQHLIVFVLAIFVGFQVVWNVAPALHTPLMSVTNAISGIIVIGALLQIGNPSWIVVVLAAYRC